MAVNMSVKLCGKYLKNPVIAASGTFAFGEQHSWFIDINRLGGIALKSLTPEKRIGNKPPRIAETVSGIINSVGLQNPGVDAFIDKTLKKLEKFNTVTIANVAGQCIDDYVYVVDKLNDTHIDFFELNISCPNVKMGGASIGTDEKAAKRCVRQVMEVTKKPVIVKLTPAAGNVVRIAAAVESAGADAVSLINTLPAMAVDAKTKCPILGNITGGLSGPCIKPVALKMVYDVSQAVDIPIIGMGGIMTGEDVAEFMLCGAAAVMVGTANLIDPEASLRILAELEDYAEMIKIDDISALTGALEVER
ncbi:MAG: dihydroorotate dehydrogenase [Christensenellales bacterium]|jgi:dihydroorotate dehydrogenase (NAD+) catalytic subunit